jgi:hypothetical protein
VTADAPNPPKSGAIRLHGARKGEIGKALARSLAEARREGRVPGNSVVAVLAVRMAGVADAAWRASDHRAFMIAVAKLTPLLRSLRLDTSSIVLGGDDGDAGGSGEGDPIDRELAELVGSGPEVRHHKDA